MNRFYSSKNTVTFLLFTSFAIFAFSFFSLKASDGVPDPSAPENREYFTVDRVEFVESGNALDSSPRMPHISAEPTSWILVNLAAMGWKVFTGSAPSVEAETSYATAVPESVGDWTEITNWKGPFTRNFKIKGINLLGIPVAGAEYSISYLYGGSLDGSGQYLTNVKVLPLKITAAAGFHVKLDAQLSPPYNIGTADQPIAALEVLLKHRVGSFLQSSNYVRTFQVAGDGRMAETTNTPTMKYRFFQNVTRQ